MVKRKNLTNQQKQLIQVLYQNLNQYPEEIMKNESLKRENGKPIQKRTVLYCIKRIDEIGDFLTKKRSGRPRKMNENDVDKLVKMIDKKTNDLC